MGLWVSNASFSPIYHPTAPEQQGTSIGTRCKRQIRGRRHVQAGVPKEAPEEAARQGGLPRPQLAPQEEEVASLHLTGQRRTQGFRGLDIWPWQQTAFETSSATLWRAFAPQKCHEMRETPTTLLGAHTVKHAHIWSLAWQSKSDLLQFC